MAISFVNNEPALLVKEERLLVVGDLHIGLEFKFRQQGIHFVDASRKMGERLFKIYKSTKAKGIVLLGDIKESITYPANDEYVALRNFFYQLRDINLTFVRGNHDAYLDKVLHNFGIDVEPKKELILSKTALLHGNTMPSDDAMKKSCIVMAHGHAAMQINELDQKVWVVANPSANASKEYNGYNKKVRLIVLPAFSELIIGKRYDESSKSNMPVFRNDVFGWSTAKIYDLHGNLIKAR